MRLKVWGLIGLATIAVAVGAGVVTGRVNWFQPQPPSTSHTKNEASDLTVPTEKLNFGTVWASSEFDWTLPITNRSDRTQEIVGFELSCTCMAVTPNQLTLAPGQTGEVTVRVDLFAKYQRDSAFRIQARTKGESGERIDQAPWVILGRVNKFWEVDRPLDFGHPSALAQPLAPTKCTITAASALDAIEVSTDDARFGVTLRKAETGLRYELIVAPNEQLNPGKLNQVITVSAKVSGGSIPIIRIPVGGFLERDAEILPSAIVGGSKKVGASWVEYAECFSRTGHPIRVISIRSDSPNVLGKIDNRRIQFTISGDTLGHCSAKVWLSVEAGDGKYEVPMEIVWVGVQ